MRDEAVPGPLVRPEHDGGIYTAARAWFADPAAAKAKYGPIASWDVSEVTNLRKLFCNQAAFNEDLSRWNVSNVRNMTGMFEGATSFNGDLSRWDVSNVEDMAYMFRGAYSFNGDLSRWNVSSAENMNGMFETAINFNGDISFWDVSSVKSMDQSFKDSGFNRVLDGAWSTSTANMREIFQDRDAAIAGREKDGSGSIDEWA